MRFFVSLLLLGSAVGPAGAAAGIADEARRIETRFMAPCCWHENLTVHDSPVARQLRAEVSERVAKGETEDRIVALFVDRYGERILAEPRGIAFGILTLTPVAVVFVALSLLILWLTKRSRRPMALPE